MKRETFITTSFHLEKRSSPQNNLSRDKPELKEKKKLRLVQVLVKNAGRFCSNEMLDIAFASRSASPTPWRARWTPARRTAAFPVLWKWRLVLLTSRNKGRETTTRGLIINVSYRRACLVATTVVHLLLYETYNYMRNLYYQTLPLFSRLVFFACRNWMTLCFSHL